MAINNPYVPGDPYSYDLKWIVAKIKEHSTILSTLDQTIEEMIIAMLDQHDPVYWKNADELIHSGMKAQSLAYIEGFYTPGDGGANLYYITSDYNDVLSAIYYLTMDGANKWAIPIIMTSFVTPEMFGAHGNGTDDDTSALQFTLTKFRDVRLPGRYLISDVVTVPGFTSVIGLHEPVRQEDTEPAAFIFANDNCQIDLTGHSSVTLKNLQIVHETTQAVVPLKMTSCRYCTIENVVFVHSGTCTVNAIDDTGGGLFSGYNNITRVVATYYNCAIKTEATFINIYDCIFNGNTQYAIWKTRSGIGIISGCDITKGNAPSTSRPIRYDGEDQVDVVGCYFEGYYNQQLVEHTKERVKINIQGCRFFISNGDGSNTKVSLNQTAGIPDLMLQPLALDGPIGNDSLVNLVVNPAFDRGDTFGWIGSNYTLQTGGPASYQNYIHWSSGTIRQVIKTNVRQGSYYTLSFWFRHSSGSGSAGYVALLPGNTSTYSTTFAAARVPYQHTNWTRMVIYGKAPSDDTEMTLLFLGTNWDLTGFNVSQGLNPHENIQGNNTSYATITDNIVLSKNGLYYKIDVDPGTLAVSATQITSL